MSFEKWETVQLSDICIDISYGYTESANYERIGPKFLRITDIVSSQINWDTVPYCKISESHKRKYQLKIGDIVIARTGATTGSTAIIKEEIDAVFASYLIRFRINQNLANPFFVGFVLKSNLWVEYLKGIIGGSAQPGANANQFGSFELQLPPLPTQRRIAALLTALDDKIELNRRMNMTLEVIAQSVWKEWFGGYSNGGESLPEGWRWGKVKEIYKTTSGGTPSRKKPEFYENGTIDWVKSKELKTSFVIDSEEKITDLALKSSSAKLLPKKSVLIAMYGATVGEVSILSKVSTCNQAICAVIPNSNYPYSFAYQFLKNEHKKLKNLAVGAAQQNISQDLIQNLELLIPSIEDLKKYHALAEPIYDSILENLHQSRTLSALRDTLLPQLMSGEINI